MKAAVEGHDTPAAKYPPSMPFTIENIRLKIEPNFSAKKIFGEEQLKLLARQDISEIELDVGELVKIRSVIFSTGADSDTTYDKRELHPEIHSGKLLIHLGDKLNEGTKFHLVIAYTAENSERGNGFHFENGNPAFPAHAWTLSESIYSRNWYPCVDHPQIRFTKEISVVVPTDFTVISNGELDITDQKIQTKNDVDKRKFVWEQSTSDTAYLTCVMIGKFKETSGGEQYNGIPLRYYVPKGREADAQRTFKNTASMMKIFEEYFGVKYPYNKYSQVVVKGLASAGADGMEHTSCSTLDIEDVLAESSTPEDRIRDDVIAHELAHQWFGDLVTCRDWQDIWLNEGFAAFCEALYFQKSRGDQEYETYIAKMVDTYIRTTKDPRPKTPIRAIVTNKYEHPDDLFDHNTYNKGGIILHMLRKYIGEDDFRKSLYTYLERFKYKTAETEDLRQVMEEVSGINLQQFFEQWIYRAGHPILSLQISDDHGKVKLSLTQEQEDDAFAFPLEVHFALSSTSTDDNIEQRQIIEQIQISQNTFSKTFDFPMEKLDQITIDPEYKILKEYSHFNVPGNLVANQLEKGKTIFTKLEAGNLLKRITPSSKLALNIMKRAKPDNSEWRVSVEATKLLNASLEKGDNSTHVQAYEHLVRLLQETSDSRVRRATIEAIGNLKEMNSFDLLMEIVQDNNADPYERYFAAIAIGNTDHKEALPLLKKMAETSSYHNRVACGAIEGLKIIAINSKDNGVKGEVESFIIEKTMHPESRLRRTATSSLGYIARYRENRTKIINRLKDLLHDESFYVRNTACIAIANALEGTGDSTAIRLLTKVAQEDIDSIVRSTASACIKIVKAEVRTTEKRKSGILDEETKIDSKYKSEKFDLLEEIRILP